MLCVHSIGRFTLPPCGQVRHAATLKAIKIRMRSVTNIQKITKAMKMVSAAKLRHDMRRMENGLPFARPVTQLFNRLPRQENNVPLTIFALTSDKGLCGAINSSVAKAARLEIVDQEAAGKRVELMLLGNKGPSALSRLFGNRFTHTFDEHIKFPWNFGTAAAIAERIVTSNPKSLKMVNNHYKSMIAFETELLHTYTKEEIKTIDRAEWSKAIDQYTFEPSVFEIWDDLHEFYYGCMLFGNYLDALASEQSARMNAMENASKNAGELLEKLGLIYNRQRQAKITTELCEIISGASAV